MCVCVSGQESEKGVTRVRGPLCSGPLTPGRDPLALRILSKCVNLGHFLLSSSGVWIPRPLQAKPLGRGCVRRCWAGGSGRGVLEAEGAEGGLSDSTDWGAGPSSDSGSTLRGTHCMPALFRALGVRIVLCIAMGQYPFTDEETAFQRCIETCSRSHR